MENEKELKELQGHIDKQVKALETAFDEKNESKTKEITDSLKGMEGKVAELLEAKGVDAKTVKDMQAEMAKIKEFKNTNTSTSFKSLVENATAKIKEDGNRKGKEYDLISKEVAQNFMQTKAVGDMTIGNFSGNPSVQYHSDGVALNQRLVHIRSLLSTGAMSTEAYQYEVESGNEGAPTSAAEGVAVGQMDNDFTSTTVLAKKIGGFFRTSEESLNDIPWLNSFLQTRGIERVLKVEDTELLGSSTGFDGFDQNALADTADNAAYGKTVSDVTKFDALQFAITKLLNNETMANGIVMNPIDYAVIYTATDADGRALSPLYWVGGRPTIGGVPIYLSTAVTVDKFFVGDWSMNTAQLLQRDGLTVKFFEQDSDNATEGKVTIRIQERIALAIYKPSNVLYGDFSDVMASLSV